jgi:peptidoglycan hydrolase CwlO-like protein
MTEDEIENEYVKLTAKYEKVLTLPTNTIDEINRKQKLIKKLKNQVAELICIGEVEHFLENGPMGKDPE